MALKIGKVSGIEIRLHYTWFIIFVLLSWSLATGYLPTGYPGQSRTFYWSVGAASAVILFLSVLLHEIAHSLIAQRFKMDVTSITLYFLGGVSEIGQEVHTPEAELRMASAGPMTSLLLSITFAILWFYGSGSFPLSLVAVIQYASYINLILAIFNLIPAFPMDGGRVLRSVVWKRRKDILSSTRIATGVSKGISYGFIALGLLDTLFFSGFDGLWLLIIGFYISSSAEASMNETRVSQALSGVTVSDIMSTAVHTVETDYSIQEVVNYAFNTWKHRGFPVLKNGQILGLITDEDVRKVPPELWDAKRVSDIMRPAKDLITVSPKDAASDALIKMAKAGVGRLPVIEEGKLVGIITRSDFTSAINKRLRLRS